MVDKHSYNFDGILQDGDKYIVKVRIQDGYEYCGTWNDIESAKNAYKFSQKILNKNDKKEINIYKETPHIEFSLERINV